MLQATWEIIVNYGVAPMLYAAIYHPLETIAATFGLAAIAIWRA